MLPPRLGSLEEQSEIAASLPHIAASLTHIAASLPHIAASLPHIAAYLPHIAASLPHIAASLPHIATSPPRLLRGAVPQSGEARCLCILERPTERQSTILSVQEKFYEVKTLERATTKSVYNNYLPRENPQFRRRKVK